MLVTFGQQSLGAFVLHVYAILLIAYVSPSNDKGLAMNTLLQVAVILGIAGILAVRRHRPVHRTSAPIRGLQAPA